VDIFWVEHRGIKVGTEGCPFPRQNAVEEELDNFKRSGVGANNSRVA
jgi:hypothetical protein